MLGYVKPFKPDLKVREFEIYSGYYCGVCKYIGKNYGQLPRFSLSYDAAFLAMILASADPAPDKPSREHCIVHPAKKKTIIRNEAIEYAGDVMLVLAWFKILDDVQDEGKIYAKATVKLLHGIYKKLKKKHPALCKGVAENLAELNALEKAHCDSIDQVAEPFARIMEVRFSEGSRKIYGHGDEVTELHEIFANIGYHMGKWVYLIDAVDDIEENLKSGAYNPLFYRFAEPLAESKQSAKSRAHEASELLGEKKVTKQAVTSGTAKDFRERIREDLEFNLFQYLAILSEQISALAMEKNSGIIDNVIYFGLNRKTEEILDGKSDKQQNKPLRKRVKGN